MNKYTFSLSNIFIGTLFIAFVLSSSLIGVAQQVKFGYVAADQIILAMPETRTIDTLLRQFKTDSIDAILPYLLSEYNRKDSLSKTEKNAIIKKQTASEAEQLKEQLANWNQISQSRLQEKQNALLAPIYKKVSDAINKIAEKENYQYIFRAESLLHAPEGDNVSEKVLDQLGIKLPVRPQLGN